MSSDSILSASYQAAEQVMKAHSKSFYQAFSAIPPHRFQGVAAVYAFCRYVDDLVDEASGPTSAILAELDLLAAAIDQLGQAPAPERLSQLAWWPAFQDTVLTFGVSGQALLEQIQGQKSDLTFRDFDSLEDLEGYCRQVAGSVGAMLWPMLGHEEALAAADQTPYLEVCYQLGVGMQLTNILRDVGEDARQRQRVYLPKDILASYGWTTDQILTLANQATSWRDIPASFGQVWEAMAQVSSRYYQTLDHHLAAFHPSCRLGLLAAARIYHAIEDQVRDDHYNCLTKRHYTSPLKRLAIVNEAKQELKRQDL